MTPTELLDLARTKCTPPTDYRLAKRIGESPQMISNTRSGRRALTDEQALLIADIAGIDPAAALAVVHMGKQKDPRTRAAWERVARQFGAPMAIVLALVLGSTGPVSTYGAGVARAEVYIM